MLGNSFCSPILSRNPNIAKTTEQSLSPTDGNKMIFCKLLNGLLQIIERQQLFRPSPRQQVFRSPRTNPFASCPRQFRRPRNARLHHVLLPRAPENPLSNALHILYDKNSKTQKRKSPRNANSAFSSFSRVLFYHLPNTGPKKGRTDFLRFFLDVLLL